MAKHVTVEKLLVLGMLILIPLGTMGILSSLRSGNEVTPKRVVKQMLLSSQGKSSGNTQIDAFLKGEI